MSLLGWMGKMPTGEGGRKFQICTEPSLSLNAARSLRRLTSMRLILLAEGISWMIAPVDVETTAGDAAARETNTVPLFKNSALETSVLE